MKTALRRAAWALLALAALAGIAVVAGLFALDRFVSNGELKAIIEKSASAFLQRPLTIERLARPSFTELAAYNVRLREADGRTIVWSPEVRARGSLRSALKLRFGVDEMEFIGPRIEVRFGRDGTTNIERIARDIAGRPRSAVSRSAVTLAFHRFRIRAATVTATDARGAALLERPVRADGKITLRLSARGFRHPYELELDGGEGGFRARVTGRFSRFPKLSLVAERLPARLLAPRFPQLADCAGTTDGRFAWSRRRRETTMDFALAPSRLCPGAGGLPERLSGAARRERDIWTFELDAAGEQTEARLLGEIPPAPGRMAWSATAPRADAAEVAGWVRGFRSLFVSSGPAAGPEREATFTVHAGTLTVRPVALREFQAEIHRSTAGVVRVEPAGALLYGGEVNGRGSLESGTVTVDVRGSRVDLGRAVQAFGSTTPLTGRLAFHVAGAGPASDLVRGFAGELSLRLTDGRIPEVPAIIKTLTSANLVKLDDQLRGRERVGIEVTKGEASATVGGGVADVNHLLLESRVLRIGYTGKVAYVARGLDGILVLQPLNLADQIINDIPILRTLLLGDDKTFLPLWFKVRGTWSDPEVRSMPGKSLTAPVRHVFEGLLKLPQKAIDAIRGKKN